MTKCDDCWCEHYDKSRGNCDHCTKDEEVKDKSELRVILKRRAVNQMVIDRKNKEYGQNR